MGTSSCVCVQNEHETGTAHIRNCLLISIILALTTGVGIAIGARVTGGAGGGYYTAVGAQPITVTSVPTPAPAPVYCSTERELLAGGSFGRLANELMELGHALYWAKRSNRTLLIEPLTERKRKVHRIDGVFDLERMRRVWPCIRALDHNASVEIERRRVGEGRARRDGHIGPGGMDKLEAVVQSTAKLVFITKKTLFFEGRRVPVDFQKSYYANLRLVPFLDANVQRVTATILRARPFVGVHLRSFKEPGIPKACPGRIGALEDFRSDGKYSAAFKSAEAMCFMPPAMVRRIATRAKVPAWSSEAADAPAVFLASDGLNVESEGALKKDLGGAFHQYNCSAEHVPHAGECFTVHKSPGHGFAPIDMIKCETEHSLRCMLVDMFVLVHSTAFVGTPLSTISLQVAKIRSATRRGPSVLFWPTVEGGDPSVWDLFAY